MNATTKDKKSADFHCEYFSSITQKKVEWLWFPYIPYGKLTVLQGDPGEGKSTFMLTIAALLTKGKSMPDGYEISGPENVVYQTAEDNLADTVKPRLVAARADCNRIAYIVDDEYGLTLEDDRIEKAIQHTKARLFILDPLQAYLAQDSDMYNAGRMRQQLKRLANIASLHKCAIVIIGHMNKATGEKNLYRGLGSIDIAAIARSVLMLTRDKNDPNIRYMFPIKSSLAPEGKAVAFTLNGKHGIEWLGERDFDKTEIIENSLVDDSKKSLCRRLLSEMLMEHDMSSNEILNKLHFMGISSRTANSAKKEIGVLSYKKGDSWFWRLP